MKGERHTTMTSETSDTSRTSETVVEVNGVRMGPYALDRLPVLRTAFECGGFRLEFPCPEDVDLAHAVGYTTLESLDDYVLPSPSARRTLDFLGVDVSELRTARELREETRAAMDLLAGARSLLVRSVYIASLGLRLQGVNPTLKMWIRERRAEGEQACSKRVAPVIGTTSALIFWDAVQTALE